MGIIRFKICYLIKLYWQSYKCVGLQRLVVESAFLRVPFSMAFRFKKFRIYVLRSAHAQNKAAESLEYCTWVGKSQFFCLFSITSFLESHLLLNEGTLLHKLICYLEFSGFSRFKLFFGVFLK